MVNAFAGIVSWFQEWMTEVDVLSSLLLTGTLVYLYFRQTSIQEGQQDLLKRELNREVRQGHTETLRKRIRAWHGDIDEIGISEGSARFSDETNLPKVQAVDVKPAPALFQIAGQEPEFRVVPEALEDDRYLKDLLENHAEDLRGLKEEIERQYKDFEGLRNRFVREYPEPPGIEMDEYALQPRSEFSTWVFEKGVSMNRELRGRDKKKIKDIAESRLTGTNSANVETGEKFYSPSGIDGAGPSTYEARALSGDFDDLKRIEEEIEAELVEIHSDAIEQIDATPFYVYAIDAAETLDEMAKKVEQLRSKLEEHEGHPIYLEDCEYLEDVTL